MIGLRNFSAEDIPLLQKYRYPDLTEREIREMMDRWGRKEYEGKYFEQFAVADGRMLVGSISLYQHTRSVVSFGLEIFVEYRRRGYASAAVGEAFQIAKSRGFGVVLDQVRADHTGSVALHEKLGFESDGYQYINQKGNGVYLFLKLL